MRRYDVAFYLPSLGPLLFPSAKLPSEGGAETQIWLLARAMAEQGRSVCVVVTDPTGDASPTVDGIDVVVRPPLRAGGVGAKLAELRALWRTLGPLDAEVVVQRTAGISTGLVGALTKLKRRRFVYSSANVVDFDFERLASSSTELRLFNLGVRLADVIVVQTEEQAERCRQKFGRSSTVISSIAEPASPQAGLPEALLWVGRLIDYKRPEAFLNLARAVPEAHFQMVGLPSSSDPDLARRIRREASQLANLELLEPRPRPQLLELYDRAVAIVNTADWEGMPNVFLEGWARGIPALALSHDPDGVIVSNGLGDCAEGSPERLAELAREAWSARKNREAAAERCREYVRRRHGLDAAVAKWSAALGLHQRQRSPAAMSRTVAEPSLGHSR